MVVLHNYDERTGLLRTTFELFEEFPHPFYRKCAFPQPEASERCDGNWLKHLRFCWNTKPSGTSSHAHSERH